MSILDESDDLFETTDDLAGTNLFGSLNELGIPRIVACSRMMSCDRCVGHKYNVISNGCPVCSAPIVYEPDYEYQDLCIIRCESCGHHISICGNGDVDGIAIPDWRTDYRDDTV